MGETTYVTLKKTIKGLEELESEAYDRWVHSQHTRDKLINGIGEHMENAIQFLKLSVPYVLKFDDLKDIHFPVCVETEIWQAWAFVYYIEDNGVCFIRDDGETITLSCDTYNKTWRCWNKYPCHEQTLETKWDN